MRDVRAGLMTVRIWRIWYILWTHHDIREMSQTKASLSLTRTIVAPYVEPELSIVLVKLWGFTHRCDQDVGLPFMPIYGDP